MVTRLTPALTSGVYTVVTSSDGPNTHTDTYTQTHTDTHTDKETNTGRGDVDEDFPSYPSASSIPLEFIDAYIKIIIDEIRSQTGIHLYKIGIILQALSHFSGSTNDISRSRFVTSMKYLTQHSDRPNSAIASVDSTSTFEQIFDALAKSGSSSVNVFRICRFLGLFCGGTPAENVKILYFLFDDDRDGSVSTKDVYSCFLDFLTTFSELFADVFDTSGTYYLDDVALILTRSVFKFKGIGGISRGSESEEGCISLEEFYAWYSASDRDHLIFSAQPRCVSVVGRTDNLTVESVGEAREMLGMDCIIPATLKDCLANYAEYQQPSFISLRGVFCAVVVSSRVHNLDPFSCPPDMQDCESRSQEDSIKMRRMQRLLRTETLLLKIFNLFDPLRSGYVNKDDIFCGLSPFCGGTWIDRVTAMFTSSALKQRPILHRNETCLQLQVSQGEMVDYLVCVLKSVLLFSVYDLDEASVQRLASRMLDDALAGGAIPCQGSGLVSAIDFANWIDSAVDVSSGGRNSSHVVGAGEDEDSEVEEEAPTDSAVAVEVDLDEDDDDDIFDTPGESPANAGVGDLLSDELGHVKVSLGFEGFSAEDVMDLLGECSHAGLITLSAWLKVVENMRDLAATPSSHSQNKQALQLGAKIFYSVAMLSDPVFTGEGEEAVSYALFLAALTVLCDSPVEDKIAVAFMVLADVEGEANYNQEPEQRTVSYGSLVDYFSGVLSIVCVCSPTTKEKTKSFCRSLNAIAKAGVDMAIARSELRLNTGNYDMQDFCAIAWVCLDIN